VALVSDGAVAVPCAHAHPEAAAFLAVLAAFLLPQVMQQPIQPPREAAKCIALDTTVSIGRT